MTNAFTKITEGSLTSIGQYCDHGHKEIFTKKHMGITYEGKLTLRGHRNPSNKLWCFDLNKKISKTIESETNTVVNNTMK